VSKAVQGGTTTVSIIDGSRVIAEHDNGAVPSSPWREHIYGGRALAERGTYGKFDTKSV